MSKPVVASYCTTFLKPEMRHVYRQVTGLRRYETFVLTCARIEEASFPFSNIEVLPEIRVGFARRLWLKHLTRKPPVYYRGTFHVLFKALSRRPADLMHIYFGHTAVSLLPFIREWRRPCVVSFHGVDVRSRAHRPGYDDDMRRMLQTVPLVLARSKSLFAALEAWGCPTEKLRLNRTGIPLEDFPLTERTAPKEGAWRLVQACRLIEKKGLRTTLRAFAKFQAAHPRATLSIAGDGPMRHELESLATELAVRPAVEFCGFLGQKELAALYRRSDLFVHPSEKTPDQNQEGVPNSMLEAMATGLPVVATTHGGIPEAVTHEHSGLLVPERDVDALHDALRRITSDPRRLLAWGAAAASAVRSQFESGEAIRRLEAIYDEAIERSGGRVSRDNPPVERTVSP